MPRAIKSNFAIIFDMDGVIVNSSPYHEKAWKQFFENHGVSISSDEINRKLQGRLNSENMRAYLGEISNDLMNRYIHEKETLYRKLIKAEISPVHGLLKFLSMLKDKNITRAIATSAPPENVELILRRLKIKSYFNAIVDANQVTKGKPNPEIYLKAANIINYPAKNCIVIEDSLSGIKAAQNAGMKVIAISTTHSMKELLQLQANMVINDFTELTYNRLLELIDKTCL